MNIGTHIAIPCENKRIMKNLRKNFSITLLLLIGFVTISVTNAPHNKRYRGIERSIKIERWMTVPFTDFYEEPLEVEDWMTKPFNAK